MAGAPALVSHSLYWAGRAFGLELHSDFEVHGLQPIESRAPAGATALRLADADAIEASWNQDEAERILERRFTDGHLMMSVDSHESAGFLIYVYDHGTFLVRPNGGRIECPLPPGPAMPWLRLLFAQALPLAATLQGFELFHASAVGLNGRAAAFVGHSGAGKTSLAVHLVARGATLLTDDVLSLEPRGDRVWAHPGVQMANVADEQLSAISAGPGRSRFGAELGKYDKIHVAVDVSDEPLPLESLYFLERRPSIRELAFEEMTPPDPRTLLRATFMPHVTTPRRLMGQLDACHGVAETTRVFNLRVPERLGAPALAEAVEAHVLSAGARTP